VVVAADVVRVDEVLVEVVELHVSLLHARAGKCEMWWWVLFQQSAEIRTKSLQILSHTSGRLTSHEQYIHIAELPRVLGANNKTANEATVVGHLGSESLAHSMLLVNLAKVLIFLFSSFYYSYQHYSHYYYYSYFIIHNISTLIVVITIIVLVIIKYLVLRSK
jgi:hypothetical protein